LIIVSLLPAKKIMLLFVSILLKRCPNYSYTGFMLVLTSTSLPTQQKKQEKRQWKQHLHTHGTCVSATYLQTVFRLEKGESATITVDS
jgi:hypothetical protein